MLGERAPTIVRKAALGIGAYKAMTIIYFNIKVDTPSTNLQHCTTNNDQVHPPCL